MIRALLAALGIGLPMRRPPVYIAGPFAPNEGLTSEENTRRAVILAMHYRRLGHRVTCVHPDILGGVYGDDTDPVQRAQGAERTLHLCRVTAEAGGILAVLELPSGALSSGSSDEVRAFRRSGGETIERWTWNDGLRKSPVIA